MLVTFTVTEGLHAGKVFSFGQRENFIVGRSTDGQAGVSLEDPFCSRHHFVVEVNPPVCRLMDLGSRNGTFVNGQRVTEVDLKDGDVIQAGQTVLKASIQRGVSPLPAYATVYPETAAWTQTPAAEPRPTSKPAEFTPIPANAEEGCPVCGASVASRGQAGAAAPRRQLCPACIALAQALPQSIAGYRLVRELGRGAMGVVHVAIRIADDRAVALKTVTPQTLATPRDVARFLREANILRDLDHPHIVAFRDMGESSGRFFFTMDYVRGIDAGRLLKAHPGGLPIGRAVELACQLLDGLEYAHARKFVHRDIKPQNLLVMEGAAGGRDVAKLADFGLARVYQAATFSGLTMKGDYGGTYPFMPPEQITNFRDSTPANDIYAAGATLYTLLTGRFVYDFPKSLEGSVRMLLQEEPVPIVSRRGDIPIALAKIVHRALIRDPQARFPAARAMRESLQTFRAG